MIYIYHKLVLLIDEMKKQRGQDFTLEQLAEESAVPLTRLKGLLNNQVASATVSRIDRLCSFFQLTDVGELIEYRPDHANPPWQDGETEKGNA